MTEFTDVITDDANPTTAYTRPAKPDWRHRLETTITHIEDAYNALWDLMPAIAAFAVLIWLATVVPNHHQ